MPKTNFIILKMFFKKLCWISYAEMFSEHILSISIYIIYYNIIYIHTYMMHLRDLVFGFKRINIIVSIVKTLNYLLSYTLLTVKFIY